MNFFDSLQPYVEARLYLQNISRYLSVFFLSTPLVERVAKIDFFKPLFKALL